MVFRNARLADSVISVGDAQNPQRNQLPWRPSATEPGPFELTPPEMSSQSGESVNPNPSDTRP